MREMRDGHRLLFLDQLYMVLQDFQKSLIRLYPGRFIILVEHRFTPGKIKPESKKAADSSSFDLLRASVNTYCCQHTDRFRHFTEAAVINHICDFYGGNGNITCRPGLGRESAVYRVQESWQWSEAGSLLAIIAFTAAFIIAQLLSWGGVAAILTALAAALIICY